MAGPVFISPAAERAAKAAVITKALDELSTGDWSMSSATIEEAKMYELRSAICNYMLLPWWRRLVTRRPRYWLVKEGENPPRIENHNQKKGNTEWLPKKSN